MYQEITRGIRVSVNPTYLEGQSDPSQGHYVWAYQVTIANEGPETVQLLTRHWKITDGRGQLHEVQGPGVVGEFQVGGPFGAGFERGGVGDVLGVADGPEAAEASGE